MSVVTNIQSSSCRIMTTTVAEAVYEKVEGGANTSGRSGITLEWSNIHLSVGSGDKEKILLHSMAGVARPQELLAVMGSSGAGFLYIYTKNSMMD